MTHNKKVKKKINQNLYIESFVEIYIYMCKSVDLLLIWSPLNSPKFTQVIAHIMIFFLLTSVMFPTIFTHQPCRFAIFAKYQSFCPFLFLKAHIAEGLSLMLFRFSRMKEHFFQAFEKSGLRWGNGKHWSHAQKGLLLNMNLVRSNLHWMFP